MGVIEREEGRLQLPISVFWGHKEKPGIPLPLRAT